jgi:hypothetical protein
MVYAFIQDVPIGEEVYRRVIEGLGPEPLAGQLLHLCVRQSDGRLHRRLGVRTSMRPGLRGADSPDSRCRVRWSAAFQRARSPTPRRPARQWLAA